MAERPAVTVLKSLVQMRVPHFVLHWDPECVAILDVRAEQDLAQGGPSPPGQPGLWSQSIGGGGAASPGPMTKAFFQRSGRSVRNSQRRHLHWGQQGSLEPQGRQERCPTGSSPSSNHEATAADGCSTERGVTFQGTLKSHVAPALRSGEGSPGANPTVRPQEKGLAPQARGRGFL